MWCDGVCVFVYVCLCERKSEGESESVKVCVRGLKNKCLQRMAVTLHLKSFG